MTKAELVERVANQINLTKKQTEVVVNTVFSSITESLAEGKKVELRGFGSFRIRQRNARIGRNPKSGQKVEVPSKNLWTIVVLAIIVMKKRRDPETGFYR